MENLSLGSRRWCAVAPMSALGGGERLLAWWAGPGGRGRARANVPRQKQALGDQVEQRAQSGSDSVVGEQGLSAMGLG